MRDPRGIVLGKVQFEGEMIESEHPGARKLIDYWRSKRSGHQPPARPLIRPDEILSLLPNVFIAEPTNGDWRYRLAGTGIAGRVHVELTGKTLRQVFEPGTAEFARKLYASVADGTEPVSSKGRFLGLGIEDATVENIHLPILAPDGQTVWILGGVFFFVYGHTPWDLPL